MAIISCEAILSTYSSCYKQRFDGVGLRKGKGRKVTVSALQDLRCYFWTKTSISGEPG